MEQISTIIGIDPGVTGAVALLNRYGDIVDLFDMPSTDSGVDEKSLAERIGYIMKGNIVISAYIEKSVSFSTDSHTRAFAFGKAYGAIRGVVSTLGIPIVEVRPLEWRKDIGIVVPRLTGEKKGAHRARIKNIMRATATSQWPDRAIQFSRVKDADRAEAALIGLYGVRNYGQAGQPG